MSITSEERQHLLGITRLLYAARGDSVALAEARKAIAQAHDIVVETMRARGVEACEVDELLDEIDDQVEGEYAAWLAAEAPCDFDDWALDMAKAGL